jgi:hypothetical protein
LQTSTFDESFSDNCTDDIEWDNAAIDNDDDDDFKDLILEIWKF